MASTTSTSRKRTTFSEKNATIISAMEYLSRKVKFVDEYDGYSGSIDQTENAANTYLQRRLNLNHDQVVLLTACMFAYSEDMDEFSGSRLVRLLDFSPLQSLCLKNALDELAELGYLKRKSMQQSFWGLTGPAIKALSSNQPFTIEMLRFKTNIEFLRELLVLTGPFGPEEIDRLYMLKWYQKINPHLPIVRNVAKLAVSEDEKTLLMAMAASLARGDSYVGRDDFGQFFKCYEADDMVDRLHNESLELIKIGYIEPYLEDSFAKADGWVLTRKAWSELLENEAEVRYVLRDKKTYPGGLLSWRDLKPRNLFFSPALQQQVDQLKNLLTEEKFRAVTGRLASKGLPKGFCCLFYGTPGTGKTELVQQLAIHTERDLMQVDIAELRDKFVGESEKNLKMIFHRYAEAVATSRKAPILFFNEADAIFGNRMENTPNAVDKMENALQNIILQEMEKLEGIMICTTNLTSTLDKAFERRFLYKIEFSRPSMEVRKHIWLDMVSGLTDEQAGELAERFDFSGGQIQNISRKQIIQQVFSGTDELNYEQLLLDCNAEKLSRNNGRKIGF